MLDRLSEIDYKPHPVLTRALDKLFIVHADHELNCSTATMRQVGSSLVDPYSAVAGAATALYGPLHGGANEVYHIPHHYFPLAKKKSRGDKTKFKIVCTN